jgi:hypothetical protein
MCEIFCPARRTELERSAADICALKRAEPKRVSPRIGTKQSYAARDAERLAKDLLRIMSGDIIRTSDALPRLKALHDAPWRSYAGEGLDAIKLADLLLPVGVGPKQVKRGGKNLRGYLRYDLENAMRRVEAA